MLELGCTVAFKEDMVTSFRYGWVKTTFRIAIDSNYVEEGSSREPVLCKQPDKVFYFVLRLLTSISNWNYLLPHLSEFYCLVVKDPFGFNLQISMSSLDKLVGMKVDLFRLIISSGSFMEMDEVSQFPELRIVSTLVAMLFGVSGPSIVSLIWGFYFCIHLSVIPTHQEISS